jgi:tetratricopeptide (TPR) repeat protein
MQPDLAERIASCRARFDDEPESGVHVLLADLLREAGEFGEALSLLSDNATMRPASVSARVVLGRTLLEAGRVDDARPVLRQVLEADRDNTLALRLLAEDARSRGAWSESVPYLMRLSELEPEEPRWSAALAEARGFRDAPPTEDDAAQAGFATLTLVDIYLAQGYHARAVAALRQMVENDPDRTDARERLAALEELVGAADAGGEGTDDGTPPVAGLDPDVARKRSLRRRDQKQQFAAWLESINRDLGDAP